LSITENITLDNKRDTIRIRWELAKSQLTEEDCKTILWQALKFAI